MLINQIKHTGNIESAFILLNNKLSDDGGTGWMFLVCLFVFGLVMSFSLKRKNEESVLYRIISNISNKNTISNHKEYVKEEDNRTTDWNFDFSSLPRWDNRNRIPFVYDKFHYVPQTDVLCCIYSIAEVRMGWYNGFLAVLKNKETPELIINITEGINFCDNFSVNKQGNLLFFMLSIYNKTNSAVSCPIFIVDLANKKFAFYSTENYNPCYKIKEISDCIFCIEADEAQRKTSEKLNELTKQHIDLNSLEWFDFSNLNNIASIQNQSTNN